MKPKVVIGMSGGVDSSVAAYLLKSQGYECIGLFMKNWEDDECSAATDFDDVASVAEKLQIPYYAVNFSEDYRREVFQDFVRDYKAGLTPNPDILCNREIKFKALMNKSLELGADFLATGHYVQRTEDFSLARAIDSNKDQSYFLYTLTSSLLRKVLFPIGHLVKSEVRKIAQDIGLTTASKKDSTGICFIGERDFKEFLSRYIPIHPGPIQTLDGKTVGNHDGVAYYTLGQRKGLGIGGAGKPWFVAKKDVKENILYVVQGDDHPALYRQSLLAHTPSWVLETPPSRSFSCTAKIRYRQADAACSVSCHENRLEVLFNAPQKAITPGQSIVFYQDSLCLGGAVIEQAL